MLNMVRRLFFLLLMVPLVACAESDAPFKEGEHYVELSTPAATNDSSKIEVVELFWYGCPHCYMLEPSVNRWKSTLADDVTFVRMPAVMAKRWEVHARAFYAAEALGALDKTHGPLFDAIHRERKALNSQDSLAGFYSQYGVDQTAFAKAFKSFSVNSKMNRARNLQRAYRATGVPAIIVNGKYRVGAGMKAGAQGLFDVVDYLIEKERAQ